ncbi:putative cytochrome P450 [Neofusicoccum parvum]|nr:putative cytochrome P450 [Neofusicoccum parvum]
MGQSPTNKYTEWAQEYGPVFSIMKGSSPYVIVNEANAARELFNKLGQYTAARPDLPVDLLTHGGYEPSGMSGSVWRLARKQWHLMLNVSAAKKYLPYQSLETAKLIFDVAFETPNWDKHILRYSNSVTLSMMCGYRVRVSEDPVVQEVLQLFQTPALFRFEHHLLNFFPFVLKFPQIFIPFKKEASRIYENYRRVILQRYASTQKEDLPSFFQVLRERQASTGLSDVQSATVGELLLGAGTETTANSIHGWVAAMALFPQVQRKAQEEIDRVIGNDRPPQDEDAINLPYVRQVVQELHRWFTVAPVGLPHAASEEINWRGFTIPKGTGLIFNTMAMHHDPKVYPEPYLFIPERWAGKLEMAAEDSLGAKSELFTFGAGRRICPGQHLAERSLFLTISNWLWAFNIAKAKDPSGKEIPINITDTKPGLARMFKDFEVSIKPRSEEKTKLIRENWEHMRSEFLTDKEQWKAVPHGVNETLLKARIQSHKSK